MDLSADAADHYGVDSPVQAAAPATLHVHRSSCTDRAKQPNRGRCTSVSR